MDKSDWSLARLRLARRCGCARFRFILDFLDINSNFHNSGFLIFCITHTNIFVNLLEKLCIHRSYRA